MPEFARSPLFASTSRPVPADLFDLNRAVSRIGNMSEMACIAEVTSTELIMTARLGPPWPRLFHERYRWRNDECVQEIALVAITASPGRVEEFAREHPVLSRFWRLSAKRSIVDAEVNFTPVPDRQLTTCSSHRAGRILRGNTCRPVLSSVQSCFTRTYSCSSFYPSLWCIHSSP